MTEPAAEAAAERSVVLVVDDDAAARLMVRVTLEAGGFDVLEAEDGKPALELFRTHKVDIVLLDVMMIELDGFAVCAAIRAMPRGEHTPIMMMTGLDDTASINAAYDAGATDFVTKPIHYGVLPHRVRYLLRAARIGDELRRSEARLAQAQEMAKLGHFYWEPESGRFECSAEVARLTGLPDGSRVHGLDALTACVHPDDREDAEGRLRDAIAHQRAVQIGCRVTTRGGDLAYVHIEATSRTTGENGACAVTGVIQDVTERHRLRGLAHKLTYFDTVTGLPNRATLRKDLEQVIVRAAERETVVAVFSLDLDNFKRINDTLGRDNGDRLLKTVAERLGACLRRRDSAFGAHAGVRAGDFVARTGGDEFYVVLTEFRSGEESAIVARRMLDAIARPVELGGEDLVVSATVGISVYPVDGTTADQLIDRADVAKNHAKIEGRGRYQYYTSAINARAFERLSMENNLRKALQQDQFELHYQPKIDMRTGAFAGAEALVRWRHPDLGLVSPVNFIPIAEETGLIVPLGLWIIHAACRDLAAWRARGLSGVRVAVNISPMQFAADELPLQIGAALAECKLPVEALEVELTESLLMANTEQSIAMLAELRALGIDVWIDDFGTGYSSLAYLRRFPLAGVKVDQTFVREMDTNPNDAAIVAAVIALARSLNLAVVAEGVESEQHVDALAAQGCDFAQGYFYSPPLPAAAFAEWVSARSRPLARAI